MSVDMLATLLQVINERHGTAFEPGERYPVGEQGAFALREAHGDGVRRFVLKWSPGGEVPNNLRRAVAVTERLRDLGYPASKYRLVDWGPSLGIAYSVQDELPGMPLGGRLDRLVLDRLLELNDLQRGQAGDPISAWPGPVADPVLHGGDGFCLLETLRSYSATTEALLSVLQRLVLEGMREPWPVGDVVHFDFTGANILADRHEITGVVDWDGWCAGDRAFDLATLFFYLGDDADPDQIERLWRRLVVRTGPRLLGVYLAHLVLRQVDWSIRFHDRAEVERWLSRADDVLRRLSAASEIGA